MDKALSNRELPDYPYYADKLRANLPDVAAEIATFTGVEQVLTWMQQRGLIGRAVDIVGQDEFSYDFLVELEPAGRWLAFGVT
jgi:hypothetical protein